MAKVGGTVTSLKMDGQELADGMRLDLANAPTDADEQEALLRKYPRLKAVYEAWLKHRADVAEARTKRAGLSRAKTVMRARRKAKKARHA